MTVTLGQVTAGLVQQKRVRGIIKYGEGCGQYKGKYIVVALDFYAGGWRGCCVWSYENWVWIGYRPWLAYGLIRYIEIALNYWAGGVTLVKSEIIFIVHMTSLVTLSV